MGNTSTKHNLKDRPKKNVHWKSAESPSQPGKPILVPGTVNTQPDVVTIHWDKPKHDGGSPIIGYLVEHRRTGSSHWVRATPLLVPYPEISISGLEPGWRYQFRVIAENAVGKSEASELSDPLTVTLQRNAITAPHFTTELHDTIAIENEKVEFRVNVVGTPTPQINWFKDGFEIFSSRRTKIATDNTISSLVIHQSALTDEGEIKCTATNRAGHVVTRAHLSIEAPPKIRLPRQYEDGLIIEADEIVRLKVGIAGRPIPTVIWSHNGEMIQNDKRHEIVTTDKNSSLKITHSNRDDRGEYHIRASNKLGDDNTSFLVTVTARPLPPGKVSITMSLGKSVTLSWSAPVDDGGCKIGNYIVEYFRNGWNVWLKAATTRQLKTTLNDLIEGSEYKFRVKAENPYGLSDPSVESDTYFIPDPKRGLTSSPLPQSGNQISSIDEPLETITPSIVARRPKLDRPPIIKSQSEASKRSSSKSSVHFDPEILDSEDIVHEISYGATAASLREKSMPQEIPKEEKSEIKEMEYLAPKINDNQKDNYDVHNSSEFMLVLYPNSDGKEAKPEKERENPASTFEFTLEDSIAPPLSLSAPDLSAEPPVMPIMRHSVSSTELLYERAMSRFYQAVAYEEAEKAKKRSSSVISREQSLPPRVRLGSLTDLEKTTRRLSGEFFTHQKLQKLEFTENLRALKKDISIDSEQSEPVTEPDEDEEYTEDYTDSTEPSDESETEKFKRAVQSANLKPSVSRRKSQTENEMDTYHPSAMNVITPPATSQSATPPAIVIPEPPRSRYRSPDPDQAFEVLTRPLPLPSPDFVPKPILKRPNGEAQNQTPEKSPNKQKKKLFPKLFDRSESGKKDAEKSPKGKKKKITIDETRVVMSAEQKKLLELRQNSIEEQKVVIDHYSDIVRERGTLRPNKIPIYLDPEALKHAAYQDDESDQEKYQNLTVEQKPADVPQSPIMGRKFTPNHRIQLTKDESLDVDEVAPSQNKQADIQKTQKPEPTMQQSDAIQQASVQERKSRQPRSSSGTRAPRSRSNSALRNNSTDPSTTKPVGTAGGGGTPQKMRSRNSSRSPVARNRAVVTDKPNDLLLEKLNRIAQDDVKTNGKATQFDVSVHQIIAEKKVKSTLNYFTDVTLVLVAFWIYLFKDAWLVVPILALLVYRQISDVVNKKIPVWLKRGKES